LELTSFYLKILRWLVSWCASSLQYAQQ